MRKVRYALCRFIKRSCGKTNHIGYGAFALYLVGYYFKEKKKSFFFLHNIICKQFWNADMPPRACKYLYLYIIFLKDIFFSFT